MANKFETEKGEVYIYNEATQQEKSNCACGGKCECKTNPNSSCACGNDCKCK